MKIPVALAVVILLFLILSLAYPTINTYCTSVYRKLNINSRTELLILFREYASK